MAVDVADPHYVPPQSRRARIALSRRAQIAVSVLVFLGVWSHAAVVSDATPRIKCKALALAAGDSVTELMADDNVNVLTADNQTECRIDIGGGVVLQGTLP
jgi:hypothetical protein